MVTRYIVLRNNVYNYKKVEEISEQNPAELHFTPVKKYSMGQWRREKGVFTVFLSSEYDSSPVDFNLILI